MHHKQVREELEQKTVEGYQLTVEYPGYWSWKNGDGEIAGTPDHTNDGEICFQYRPVEDNTLAADPVHVKTYNYTGSLTVEKYMEKLKHYLQTLQKRAKEVEPPK